jgi:hypothetical protein
VLSEGLTMIGFWEGGMDAYLSALEEQHLQRMGDLKQELEKSPSAEQAREIQGQIKQEQAEHRQRVKHAGKLLF